MDGQHSYKSLISSGKDTIGSKHYYYGVIGWVGGIIILINRCHVSDTPAERCRQRVREVPYFAFQV